MSESDLDEVRRELKALEAAEALASAQRNRLHQQLDFGYANDDTRARERAVSDERQELHRRIDELRRLLGLSAGPGASGAEPADGDRLSLEPR
jgi:hypothetical protein